MTPAVGDGLDPPAPLAGVNLAVRVHVLESAAPEKENAPARTPAGVRPGGNDGRADRARLASDRREASLPFCRQFPMPQTVCRGEPAVGNQDKLSEIAQSIPPMSTSSRQARQSEHSHDHDQAFALSAGLRLTCHGSEREKRVDDLEGKDSFRSGPLNGSARLRKTVVGREAPWYASQASGRPCGNNGATNGPFPAFIMCRPPVKST